MIFYVWLIFIATAIGFLYGFGVTIMEHRAAKKSSKVPITISSEEQLHELMLEGWKNQYARDEIDLPQFERVVENQFEAQEKNR